MNDARKRLLERYFDGALAPSEHDAVGRMLADDADASNYLAQLALLRRLARAHEPTPQPVVLRVSRRRWGRPLALAASALAACLVLVLTIPREQPVDRTPSAPPASPPRKNVVASGPPAPGNPLEVEVMRLANSPLHGPEGDARVVVARTRLSAAREVFLLKLANGAPHGALSLPRSTASPAATNFGALRRHSRAQRSHTAAQPRA